jgi:hypothetical protein
MLAGNSTPPKPGLAAAWFLVSRVFFAPASILAQKQAGDVHYVESGQLASASPQHSGRLSYSVRNACIGSTRVAFRAGS